MVSFNSKKNLYFLGISLDAKKFLLVYAAFMVQYVPNPCIRVRVIFVVLFLFNLGDYFSDSLTNLGLNALISSSVILNT